MSTAKAPDVLVTGATGFVGRRLLSKLLERGWRPLLLIRCAEAVQALEQQYGNAISIVEGDLCDFSAHAQLAARIEAPVPLVHLASAIDKGRKAARAHASLLEKTNVVGTRDLLEAVGGGLSRVVNVGTADVYGYPETLPIAETHPEDPRTRYAMTKLEGEREALRRCSQLGLPLIRLRLAQVYGVGDRHQKAIPSFIRRILAAEPLRVTGTGCAKRNYVHVDDVVNAILRSLEHPRDDVFNIAGKETITIRQLAELLIELSGADLVLELDASASDAPDLIFDTRHAAEMLGFVPAEELRAGLAAQLEWFRGDPNALL